MSGNISVSQRTKHVDVRFRFVQQFTIEGFIKVIFVRTDENDVDLFTKNLNGDKYKRHGDKFITNKGVIQVNEHEFDRLHNRKGVKMVSLCCLSDKRNV